MRRFFDGIKTYNQICKNQIINSLKLRNKKNDFLQVSTENIKIEKKN